MAVRPKLFISSNVTQALAAATKEETEEVCFSVYSEGYFILISVFIFFLGSVIKVLFLLPPNTWL